MSAPKNNLNALKHGFYSKQFRAQELKDLNLLLDAGSQVDLIDEIAMLRVTIRRTMEMANGIDDINTAIRWLGVLGASASRIAVLLRTQKILGPGRGGELDAISMALEQLSHELVGQASNKEAPEGSKK